MIKVFRSASGKLHVVPGTATPVLADLLETDIKEYPPRVKEINAAIGQLERSEATGPFLFYGNLYELKLEPEFATITNVYDESVAPLVLKLTEFVNSFNVWVAAIQYRWIKKT